MTTHFCITKWCKSITDSGEDIHTGALSRMRTKLKGLYGQVPKLYDFRLLDDDGIVYAYGKCSNDSSFAPLDTYMDAYGCTDIQYKNPKSGDWESL